VPENEKFNGVNTSASSCLCFSCVSCRVHCLMLPRVSFISPSMRFPCFRPSRAVFHSFPHACANWMPSTPKLLRTKTFQHTQAWHADRTCTTQAPTQRLSPVSLAGRPRQRRTAARPSSTSPGLRLPTPPASRPRCRSRLPPCHEGDLLPPAPRLRFNRLSCCTALLLHQCSVGAGLSACRTTGA
jgi:hypothetical protein